MSRKIARGVAGSAPVEAEDDLVGAGLQLAVRTAINCYITEYNGDPKSFVYSKSAETSIEKSNEYLYLPFDPRSGPRILDSVLSEISTVFQAACVTISKYTASGVRRSSAACRRRAL